MCGTRTTTSRQNETPCEYSAALPCCFFHLWDLALCRCANCFCYDIVFFWLYVLAFCVAMEADVCRVSIVIVKSKVVKTLNIYQKMKHVDKVWSCGRAVVAMSSYRHFLIAKGRQSTEALLAGAPPATILLLCPCVLPCSCVVALHIPVVAWCSSQRTIFSFVAIKVNSSMANGPRCHPFHLLWDDYWRLSAVR